MPATLKEVRALILKEFSEANVDDVRMDHNRITGAIVSPDFKNLDVISRNELVTKKVRDPLGPKGLNVGVLFPLAPNETLH